VSSPAGPKSTGWIEGDAASSAPATTSSGARSPPNASTATRTGTGYAAGVRSGSISRPRYVLHVGQTRCGCFGCPQFGQVLTRGAEMACCARRLSRRDFDVFFLGTAMSGCGV
jgi:hypothetical protein